MGAHKKVSSRLAGVGRKFEKKVGFVESGQGPGGSKAHVFVVLGGARTPRSRAALFEIERSFGPEV